MQNEILMKQLAVEYAGSAENYEFFKKTMNASSLLYANDFHFYNDDVQSRHTRNMSEMIKLKELLLSKKMEASQCLFNTYNTFYPSFVLHHHYDIFLRCLKHLKESALKTELIDQSKQLRIIGAFFDHCLRWDLQQVSHFQPEITQDGSLKMDSNTFYYSKATSLHISVCCFIARKGEATGLCFVRVRDGKGEFVNGIKVKDFGSTISSDHLPVGYNFDKVMPILFVEEGKKEQLQVEQMSLKSMFDDFNLSLMDLRKSLFLTVKYTAMRKQFKTIDNSKQERRLITYQAVAARIIDSFALYVAFSDLNSRIISFPDGYLLYAQILQSTHHSILEKIIQLRECCGGFGYLQASGHPGCIERVGFRAGFKDESTLDLNSKFLQVTHYYSSSEELEQHATSRLNLSNPSYIDFFGVFISICYQMRKNRKKLANQVFNREFIKQSAIQAMHIKEDFSKHDKLNIHCLLLQYLVANYVIEKASFINWSAIQVDRLQFYSQVSDFKTSLVQSISQQLEQLGTTLELSFLRNAIVGREDSQNFYQEVLNVSKSNLRNSKEFQDYVKAPLVEMLTTNRAKL